MATIFFDQLGGLLIENTPPLWCSSCMKNSTEYSSIDQTNSSVVHLRIATKSDVPVITRLLWDDEQGQKRESTSPQDAQTYLSAFEQIERDPNSQVFVATLKGAVIGCLQLTVIPGLSYRGIRRALIEDVRVARSHRSRGIGGLLLGHAEADAIRLGCTLVELFVHGDRNDAHSFYEKAGYTGVHRGFRKKLYAV